MALDLPVRRPMRDADELVSDFEVTYGPRSMWRDDVKAAFALAMARMRVRWLRGEVW